MNKLLALFPILLSLCAAPGTAQDGKDKPVAKDSKAAAKPVDFQKQIWPILEKNCIECHSAPHTGKDGKLRKPKGGVILENKDGITTGKRGKLAIAKKPDDSLIYGSISLPADDEDRMPPAKKGPPLAKDQIELIKQWIEQGAEFGSWVGKKAEDAGKDKESGNKEKGDKEKGEHEKEKEKEKGEHEKPKTENEKPKTKEKTARLDPLPELQKRVKALSTEQLAAFAAGPFALASVGDDSPLLRVTCTGRSDEVDDHAVADLLPIADHVTELDLSRSRISDEACKTIAAMPLLTALDLRQTAVGDQGVAALATCKELRVLNLFGTKVGDYGLAAADALKHLEELYVWQTEVSANAVVRLRGNAPDLRVVFAADLPEPMAEAAGNGGRRRGGK